MAAPEGSIAGVEQTTLPGVEFSITAVDTGGSIFTVDISDFNQDITSVLASGDEVAVEESTGNDGSYTVSAVTDNGDGTADVTVNESISDSTADGILAYRVVAVSMETGSTLSYTSNTIEIESKDAGFYGRSLKGIPEWSLNFSAALEENDGEHLIGADGEAKVSIEYNSQTYQTPKDLDELTVSFESETSERGGLAEAKARYLGVTGQSFEITLTGSYLDPASNAGEFYGALREAQQAGDTVTVTVEMGSLSFTLPARPGDWELDAQGGGDDTSYDWTLRHDGEPSLTGEIATPLQLLILAHLNRDNASIFLAYTGDGDAPVPGSTRYSGKGPVTSMELTASRGELISVEYTVDGDGPLRQAVVA